MKRNRFLIFLIFIDFLLTTYTLDAGPVKRENAIYTQPDGSKISISIKGDEWTRIRTTTDGCVITRSEDGWWCYGVYDNNGLIKNTGYKVGKPAPSDILSASRMIPYERLTERLRAIRQKVSSQNNSALQATRAATNPLTRSSSEKIKKHGLAILVEFQDVKFTYTRNDFHRLLNQEGYNGTGSAKDYYEAQFGENWEFSFDVSEIVTLPNNLKYYGANDSDDLDIRPELMVKEACQAVDEYIDFSIYDQDGDRKVDNVYVFFAGRDEAENSENTDLIWSHQYYIYSGTAKITLECDGVFIDRYACSSELSGIKNITGIGTFCHEYMHTFGVPDFYDTNYDEDGSWSAGLWRFTSLMDGGNYNNSSNTPPNLNCIERKILGLSEPVQMELGQSYTLTPIESEGLSFKLNTDVEGEYYLFEYRGGEGWDKYINGTGMLVYHIDENWTSGTMDNWYFQNIVNTQAEHPCADLIEADNREDKITNYSSFKNIQGIFFPYKNTTSITSETITSYKYWSGTKPFASIIGIQEEDGKISFKVIDANKIPEVPDIQNFSYTAYPDALYFTFSSSMRESAANAQLTWRKSGDTEYQSLVITPSEDGKYHHIIKGLESGNVLYELRLKLELDGALGNEKKLQIMTKRDPGISWPYLYMPNGAQISKPEGYVAHIVNAETAAETAWSLDGDELKIKNGCLIYPQSNGELRCQITWKDGSTDTIIRNIIVTEE